ncbi:lipoprotein [Spiroplasma phoeniceum]|uniref:Spiroplasma plectrovirus-related protein n=1 Tax=Spiroplasma phoeniceum P40 TaxID=1276259 RepID=A0A345DPX4_9MOLU|nr:lipoprotein [Spiroplasma phoeniceum]AXF96262.1 spiroplasma plectrovirus-related protein [Spiroplasma phoeniceum P40]
MKKWLSIIEAIGLTATSTTTLISCKKENNNENGGGDNKPEPQYNSQQPPEGSNWKLIGKNNFDNEFSTKNNKSYLFLNLFDVGKYGIYLSKNNGNISQKRNNIWYLETYNPKDFVMFNTANIKSLYRWVGDSEPQIPTIDKNTGEITDWKEQKGTE